MNMIHGCETCKLFNIAITQIILFSENTTKLKRLALNYCTIQRTTYQKNTSEEEITLPDISVLKTISEHCPNLEELELWDCCNSVPNTSDDVLSDIKYFKNLLKLTVHNFPQCSTGKCFVEVSQLNSFNKLNLLLSSILFRYYIYFHINMFTSTFVFPFVSDL